MAAPRPAFDPAQWLADRKANDACSDGTQVHDIADARMGLFDLLFGEPGRFCRKCGKVF